MMSKREKVSEERNVKDLGLAQDLILAAAICNLVELWVSKICAD